MTIRKALTLTMSFAALFAAPMAVAQQPSPDPPPIVLRYGAAYSTMLSIYSLPIQAALRGGFFAREGLDVQIVVPIPGGSDKMIDALYDDTVDVTHIATPFLIRSVMNGTDAVAIATEFNNPIYSLVAKPEFQKIADLKGRMVGFADEAGSITISIRKLMAMHDVQGGDVQSRIIEGTPSRMSCLQRGACDAVPLGQPQDVLAQSQGFRILGVSTDAAPDFLYTVTAVRRSWAAQNKEAVQRYVRALARAHHFIRDPNNRARVNAIIAETNKVPLEIAEATMNLYLEPDRRVLPRQGEISMPALQGVIDMMAESGLLRAPLPKPERFIDTQYLKAAGVE
jgi:ABC-type nitrate/sulfonate/bicarbonate transport system substrate-binding protein